MENVLKRLSFEFIGSGKLTVEPAVFLDQENVVLLDVRTKEEAETIPLLMQHHANLICINIPVHEVPDRIGEIPSGKPIGVFCPGDVRSSIVYAYLLSKGFTDVRVIAGGYHALTDALKSGNVLKAVQRAAQMDE